MNEPVEQQPAEDPFASAKCLRCPNLGNGQPCPFVRQVGMTERSARYECDRGKEKWKVSW